MVKFQSRPAVRRGVALGIVATVALVAFVYYRAVWGSVPALVEALDHCRQLYCDFDRQYYPTARDILTTGRPSNGYFYSSFFALLLAPFGRLGPEQAAAWWSLPQLIGVLLLLIPALGFYRESRAAFALYVVLLAFSMPLLHNLKWGQVSTLVTGAVFVAAHLYGNGRPTAAATVLALATAVKYYIAVILLYFLVRRDWRFLAAFAVAFLLFWLVIPTLILGPEGNWDFYQTVRERVAHAVGSWMRSDINAQYLPSVVGRWFDSDGGRLFWRLTGYAIFTANAVVAGWLAARPGRRAAQWTIAILFLSLPFAIETSWPHYFVYLPFAQTLAWLELRRMSGWGRVAGMILLVVSIVLASMPFFQWIGRWQDYSRMGFLFLANFSLFVLAHAIILRQAAAESDHPATAAIPAAERR